MEQIQIIDTSGNPDGYITIKKDCIMGVSYYPHCINRFSRLPHMYMLLTTVGEYGISEETYQKYLEL
jgi:hypothetical protein